MKRLLYGLTLGALVGASAVLTLLPRRAAAQAAAPERGERARVARQAELAVRVTPQMARYSHTRYALYFAGTLIHALALLFLLRSGISARLRNLAERRSRNPLVQAYVYYPLLTATYALLTLPLAFYSGYLLPHQYGLSNQSLPGWVKDGLTSFGVTALVAPLVVALLYWTIRRSPRRWWVGFWAASIPLLIAAVLLHPLVLDPLFNRFQPLQDARLRDRILALAQRAGIERGRVFEMDASRRTKGVNAYVTGIGGSARIVLWDTLLQKLDEEEVLFVMAHEMGHYAEGHVPLGIAGGIAGTFFFLFAGNVAARRILERNGEQWQVRGLDDMASLPLLLLLVLLLNFFGSPVDSAISRTFESRADGFALRLTNNGRAAASSFVKLSELNLSHPSPPAFVELWMFSHPPLQKRIDRALAWPAAEGAEEAR